MKTTIIYDSNGLIVAAATFDADGEDEKAHAFGALNAGGRSWIVLDGALPGPAPTLRVSGGELVSASQQDLIDQQWVKVRYERFMLLAESDWRVTRATETGVPMSPQWVAYRQALRDVTTQADPFAIMWPTPPA